MEYVIKPWGSYQVLHTINGCAVKQLTIKPDQQLSLQYHNKRSEHWIVIDGLPQVTIGDDSFFLSCNQHLYIPKGVKHRISNFGKEDVIMIEVQIGNCIDEHDIVRLEDDYNRI